MNVFLRGVVALLTGVATFYFVGWMAGALLSGLLPDFLAAILGLAGGVACAAWVGHRMWTTFGGPGGEEGAGRQPPGILGSVVTGALLVGAVGFVGGFFGPILFMPDANQGPLLGLLFTGPLGVVLGAIGGAIYGVSRRGAR